MKRSVLILSLAAFALWKNYKNITKKLLQNIQKSGIQKSTNLKVEFL
jgi:hypothetical protein